MDIRLNVKNHKVKQKHLIYKGFYKQQLVATNGKNSKNNLAKVEVEGSNPFARSKKKTKKPPFGGFCFYTNLTCKQNTFWQPL